MSLDALTDAVLARCEALASCSETPGRITRRFLCPAMRSAHELLASWMRDAGLRVRVDAVGNLIGRRDGRTDRIVAIGSHVDTVPDAGRYDGVLGVLLGIAAMDALKGTPFRRSAEVIAFAEEEGVRFGVPYLGSRALVGRLGSAELALTDADGISVARAIDEFGLDSTAISRAAYPPGQPETYFEAHIEQGPVLEDAGQGLGVVTGIVGQSRLSFEFRGRSGHAGAEPMRYRRDALAGAAEFISAVERFSQADVELRATVGTVVVSPNAPNVIPGVVRLSLDVRHPADEVRLGEVKQFQTMAQEIGERRRLTVQIEPLVESPAIVCDSGLTDRLAAAIAAEGHPVVRLSSGAGHDAAILAERCPVSMLFIRSPGGLSHHPDESVRRDDVRTALSVMVRFLPLELDRE
jgi:allantoate deiminase